MSLQWERCPFVFDCNRCLELNIILSNPQSVQFTIAPFKLFLNQDKNRILLIVKLTVKLLISNYGFSIISIGYNE